MFVLGSHLKSIYISSLRANIQASPSSHDSSEPFHAAQLHGRRVQQSLPWFRVDLIIVVVTLVNVISGTCHLGFGKIACASLKISLTRFCLTVQNHASADQVPIIGTNKHPDTEKNKSVEKHARGKEMTSANERRCTNERKLRQDSMCQARLQKMHGRRAT